MERGLNYYEDGAVTDLKTTDNGYSAVVEGSDSYDVEIEFINGRVSDMYCSCPYAEDGDCCKHMAAVLFAVHNKENFSTLAAEHDRQNKTEIKKVIDRIPESEIRKIVLDLANKNEKLSNYILLKYSDEVSDNQIAQLKKEVDEIARDNSDGYGYVDWNNASGFVTDLQSFLDEKVKALMDKECLKQAFELTNYVFHCAGNIDIDDSDGDTSFIADSCYKCWKEILDKADEEEKNHMFDWFKSHQNNYVNDYMEEYLQGFLDEEFHDTRHMKNQLKLLDDIIKKAEGQNDCGELYSAYYGYENVLLKRMDLMSCLGYSKEEIEDYKKQHRHFWVIRELEINEYLQQKDYDKAVEVLHESKDIDKAYVNQMTKYSRELIDIYDKTDNKPELKNELYYQVFSFQQNDLKYIKMLKEVSDKDEWHTYQEKILELSLINAVRFSFLEFEELYEQLLNEIMQKGSIFDLDRHENVLRIKLPERTRNAYINYVLKEADNVCDRHGYKNLMGYLKKVVKFPDGRTEAVKIANAWKMEYRRRPAMMDELKKAGF